MFDMWVDFSKKCSLTSSTSPSVRAPVGHAMSSNRPNTLTIGSLHFFGARADNPAAYRAFVLDWMFDQIKECNGAHNSVAAIVWASPDSKGWYSFGGSLWREEKSAIVGVLHAALATKVARHVHTGR